MGDSFGSFFENFEIWSDGQIWIFDDLMTQISPMYL